MAVTESIFATGLSTLAQIKAWMGGDSMLNSEPVHDVERDIDADNWNMILSGLSEVARRVRKGNLCCVQYRITSLSAGATAQLERPDTAGQGYLAAPWGGSLVAISASLGSAVSAGTVTVLLREGAVDLTLEAELTVGETRETARQLPGVDTFSADGLITCLVETDASFTAAGGTELVDDAWFSFGEEEDV